MSPLRRESVSRRATLWLPLNIRSDLCAEADDKHPLETGGILLGYRAEDEQHLVVTHMVGPGPRAVHGRDRYAPDYAYQTSEIARVYASVSGGVDYLGDWHTHPGAAPYMSRKDVATLRRIAAAKAARASRPVMLVLSPGPEWEPAAWLGELRPRCVWRAGIDLTPIEVRVFPKG